MLMYRYHTLAGARGKAAAMGYKGALYAWESADTGEETTPERVMGPNGEFIDILTGKMVGKRDIARCTRFCTLTVLVRWLSAGLFRG